MVPLKTGSTHLLEDLHGCCYFLRVLLHALTFSLFWFDLEKHEKHSSSAQKTEHVERQMTFLWLFRLHCKCCESKLITAATMPTTELPINFSRPHLKPWHLRFCYWRDGLQTEYSFSKRSDISTSLLSRWVAKSLEMMNLKKQSFHRRTALLLQSGSLSYLRTKGVITK